MKKKIIVVLCTGCLLISGVAVATNLDKIEVKFGLGKGIDKAVQNGYIAEPEMDYVKSNGQIIDANKEENLENIDVLTIALSPECCGGWENSINTLRLFNNILEIEMEI